MIELLKSIFTSHKDIKISALQAELAEAHELINALAIDTVY